MATEDRKIKLVLKNHDCSRIGEVVPFASFDAVSRVNDVGEATLVASYGASDRSDAVLDALATPDVILEAFVMPPGHDRFLDTPAWAGFLRDRRITQDGPQRTVTAVFKDYNHLLVRRVVKPPAGSSHDEGYGCTPDVMRDLVRRQCAELAEADRQIPGLSVEANECDVAGGGLYADMSEMVFGSNAPEWVRVNCLYEWGGNLYLGTETSPGSGNYAAIYRSADGTTWTQVMDGSPDALYSYPITSVNCFCAFEGQLYAGCSQDWEAAEALVLRSADGLSWALATTFPNLAGVWALAEFGSDLYAGTTGKTELNSETYLWSSPDGLAWAAAASADPTLNGGCPRPVWDPTYATEERIACEALYSWGGNLYVGVSYKHTWCLLAGTGNCNSTFAGRVYRTPDGANFTQVLSSSTTHGFLCFAEFASDGMLYAGAGRTRWSEFYCAVTNIDYANGGQVWRSADGAAWTQVFGGNLDDSHYSDAVTQLMETVDYDGRPVLWASSGWRSGGAARVYALLTDGTWRAVAYLTVIPYAYILGIAYFGGAYYACVGSYAKSGEWKADYGDVWRVVPSYADVAESGMMGRWTNVLDKLREIAEQSGSYDFRVVGLDSFLYCGDTQTFEFRVRHPQWGTDNRWDGTRGVSFSIQRGNMAAPEYAEVRGQRPTFLYLLGPSAGEERTVEEFENTAAVAESPWGRIEGTADAQSIDSTTALSSIGLSELEIQGPYKEFDFVVLETERCHFLP